MMKWSVSNMKIMTEIEVGDRNEFGARSQRVIIGQVVSGEAVAAKLTVRRASPCANN